MAGAKLEGNKLLTNGGRVIGLTATAPTLHDAVDEAYRLSLGVEFKNKYYRRDIGATALEAKGVDHRWSTAYIPKKSEG